MIPERKILARGFSTPEDAFAPLRSALPWMKCVEGDLAIPVSKLIFQYGAGKGKIRYPACITAEKNAERFDVVLRVDRLTKKEVVEDLIGVVAVWLLFGFTRPATLIIVIPVVIIIFSIRFAYICRHVGTVIDAFALPYSQPIQRATDNDGAAPRRV